MRERIIITMDLKSDNNTVAKYLLYYDEWTIISHVKPDGDTLGSASALFSIGKKLNKKVKWGGRDPIPDRYLFLPNSSFYREVESLDNLVDVNDLVIALDVSTIDRGLVGLEKKCNKIINIDHHGDNGLFGDLNWIETESSAVGEMVYALCKDLVVDIDEDIAKAIYVAIVTDSGGLSYSNTTGRTCRIVGDLIDNGVKPDEISSLIYHNETIERFFLWSRAYKRISTLKNICYTWLTKKDFEETGASYDDTESLVNELSKVRGTDISILFTETDEDIKISFRSNSTYSVRELAHQWGGGGHVCAAGCKIPGEIDEVISDVLKAF